MQSFSFFFCVDFRLSLRQFTIRVLTLAASNPERVAKLCISFRPVFTKNQTKIENESC